MEETQYWLELLSESGIVPASRLTPLLQEADELTAILGLGSGFYPFQRD